VIVIYRATALPFCIWQLNGYYDSIPSRSWRRLTTAWNEYVVAALVLQDVEIFTLLLGLKMFQSNMSAQ